MEELPDDLARLELSLCKHHVDHLSAAAARLREEIDEMGVSTDFFSKALLREAQSLIFPSLQPRLELLE